MSRFNLVERKVTKFLRTPLSVRSAMAVIVTATFASVIAGGVLIRFLDPAEFPNVGIPEGAFKVPSLWAWLWGLFRPAARVRSMATRPMGPWSCEMGPTVR